MKYNNILILSFIIFVCFTSCSNKECDCLNKTASEELPEEYKNLVNKAIFEFHGKYYEENNIVYLDSALLLLNQAVRFYPKLLPAYYYKSIVYESKGDLLSTIEIIDSALKNSYPNPDMLFLKARALDHLGRTKEADNTLIEADALYSQWINCYPDSINLIGAKIDFTAYYKGKKEALKEANKYIEKYPDNDFLVGLRDFISEEPYGYEIMRKGQTY